MKRALEIDRTKELLELGRKLPSVPRDKFDMNWWVIDHRFREQRPVTVGERGTTACAIGWLPTLIPHTRIKLVSDGGSLLTPKFAGLCGLGAVETYFSLSESETRKLFVNDLLTPRGVGKRIEKFARAKLRRLQRGKR